VGIALLEEINNINQKQSNPFPELRIRVGLCSGPVLAGIVGLLRPQYDVFGPTVNYAKCLEQKAMPGAILVSDKSFQVLDGKYSCTPVKIRAKGFSGDLIAWQYPAIVHSRTRDSTLTINTNEPSSEDTTDSPLIPVGTLSPWSKLVISGSLKEKERALEADVDHEMGMTLDPSCDLFGKAVLTPVMIFTEDSS
jgi:hypothetical protein